MRLRAHPRGLPQAAGGAGAAGGLVVQPLSLCHRVAGPDDRFDPARVVCALEFFGCVPPELWWDNPTTVAPAILRGRDRRLNPYYAALARHYRFAPLFCMPARGQEKSDVERTVYALERRFATPVPQVQDRDELNRHLLRCCLKERDAGSREKRDDRRDVRGRGRSGGASAAALRLLHPADPPGGQVPDCAVRERALQRAAAGGFERDGQGVPRQIVMVHKGSVVRRHRAAERPGNRSWSQPTFWASWDASRLTWIRPGSSPAGNCRRRSCVPRQKFRGLYGDRTGTRHYIRVLQLLSSHPVEPVVRDRGLRGQADADRRDHRRQAQSFRASVSVDVPCPNTPD